METTNKSDGVQLVAEEHDNLRALLSRVRDTLTRGHEAGAEVVVELRILVDAVLLHFDQESEEEGFFDQLIARRPGLVHQVTELRREHFDLRSQLFALERRAASAVDSNADWDDLLNRFSAFELQFQRHESVETSLLQTVYNCDLGRGA